jgi:hypothetical protein
MTLELILKGVQKYGVTGVLCIVLFWMNSRLNNVEAKLYNCYEQQIIRQWSRNANNDIEIPNRIFAILPNYKIRIKRERG